ncbi:MAG: BatD family protein [Gemmatimonadales bacterium]
MVALLLLLWQTASVSITTEADRSRVAVGEEVVVTIRTVSNLPGTFQVTFPPMAGFEVAGRFERLDDVVVGMPGARSYQVEVTLRAVQVGTWSLSPLVVSIGSEAHVAPDVRITVVGTSATDPARNPRLMDLIRRVPDPVPGEAATVVTLVSDSRIYQGGQLDVLTAAWFSRNLRARLRRSPTLKPPVLPGVWSVPQPAVPGIVATRAVGNDTYDLFVSHQVTFPLTAGRIMVPPARLEYTVPPRRAVSAERPAEATSSPVPVEILPLPADAMPPGFRGPAAGGLRIAYRIQTLPAHAGEPLPVEVLLSGSGNLAFWAPPEVSWPAGTRAYLDRTAEAERVTAGLLGGTKTFHYLVVADSAGSVALPELRYDYFDAPAGFRTATAPGMLVPVLPGKSRTAGRTVPPMALIRPRPSQLALFEPGRAGWWTILLLPVLLALAAEVRRRRALRTVAPPPEVDGVAALEQLVVRLVPEADRGQVERLEGGLRRAGLSKDAAARAARLKLELDRIRFTPGAGDVTDALGREARSVVESAPGVVRRRAGLAALLVLLSTTAVAQGDPAALYRDGTYHAAAAEFERAAVDRSGEWQLWYNAAAARYLSGEDALAAARLTRALALAPRQSEARALWSTLERQYEPLHQVRPPRGLSRLEWGLLSGLAWVMAVLVIVLLRHRPRVRWSAAVLAVALSGMALGWPGLPADQAFATAAIALKRSPHGLAPDEGQLPGLTRVTVEERRSDWVRVRDRCGNRGWVPAVSLAQVDRVD